MTIVEMHRLKRLDPKKHLVALPQMRVGVDDPRYRQSVRHKVERDISELTINYPDVSVDITPDKDHVCGPAYPFIRIFDRDHLVALRIKLLFRTYFTEDVQIDIVHVHGDK